MIILSYNVRGLGRGVKWPGIRRLVREHHIDMLCIQETKKESVERSMCQVLWGDSGFSWESYPSSNAAGGILCIWNEKSFKVERRISGAGVIMVTGKWGQESQPRHIINIYSPCSLQDKRLLWERIKQLKYQNPGGYWCVLGDFNNIRVAAERVSTSQGGTADGSIRGFNEWIEEMEVEEVPWVGKSFTWFKPNGKVKSKLDRFLVSPKWLSKWPGSYQTALHRNFSDHCPILLRSNNADWGPKTFRILDCWLAEKSFKKLIEENWSSNQWSGWGGYVIKQKIKAIKAKIKVWNKEHFGDTYSKYKKIEEDLNRLEEESEER